MSTSITGTPHAVELANRHTLQGLRRRWALVAVVFVAAVLGGAWLLRAQWSPEYAQRWLLIAGIIVANCGCSGTGWPATIAPTKRTCCRRWATATG
ncbi:MAG: hypothetical protein R2851_16420 [Caldilineaceae bacterium]